MMHARSTAVQTILVNAATTVMLAQFDHQVAHKGVSATELVSARMSPINLVRLPVGQISPHVPGFDAVEATKTLLGAFELIDNERHLIELFAYESLGCRTVHFALHSLCHGGVLFLLPACELPVEPHAGIALFIRIDRLLVLVDDANKIGRAHV